MLAKSTADGQPVCVRASAQGALLTEIGDSFAGYIAGIQEVNAARHDALMAVLERIAQATEALASVLPAPIPPAPPAPTEPV